MKQWISTAHKPRLSEQKERLLIKIPHGETQQQKDTLQIPIIMALILLITKKIMKILITVKMMVMKITIIKVMRGKKKG